MAGSDIFFKKKRGQLYYCRIPLSDPLPTIDNTKHDRLKKVDLKGLSQSEKDEAWAKLRRPVDEIPSQLFNVTPRIAKRCTYCTHRSIILSHAAMMNDGSLSGISTCKYCGARKSTGCLPTPILLARVMAELYENGYKINLIIASLKPLGVDISWYTAKKAIEERLYLEQSEISQLIPDWYIKQLVDDLD